MKIIIYSMLVVLLFGCSDTNSRSAFTGEAEKTDAAPVATLSSESIYELADTFQTQDHKKVTLSSFRGKPTVVAMIFTHCAYACPRLTADMKNIESQLKDKKGKVNFLLVSFDEERDTPDTLKHYANSMGLDENWTLLHGSEDVVRTLSVLLNIQYAKGAEGNFSHSNMISVLDKSGVLRFQKEGLGADQKETISTIQKLL